MFSREEVENCRSQEEQGVLKEVLRERTIGIPKGLG
jgi:hypothetical protein